MDNASAEQNGTGQASASGTQLLDKALDLIDLIAQSDQRLTANVIAQATGHPKPTVYRILSALVRRGMLALDRRDQTYELGLRFTELSATFGKSHRLVTLAEEELIRLSEMTGENVSLAVPESDAARLVGRYSMGIDNFSEVVSGAKRPFHASSIGKAMLAWMPTPFVDRYLRRETFQALTPHTLTNREALLEDLRLVRARGYAFDDEEILLGVRCVACPLIRPDGELLGAISLSAPANRMPSDRVRSLAGALSEVSYTIARRVQSSTASPVSQKGLECVREGGLFLPIAASQIDGTISILDAAGPAIYRLDYSGSLLGSDRLPFVPRCAAIDGDGTIVLSLGSDLMLWEHLAPKLQKTFDRDIASLSADGEGRLYAALSGGDGRVENAGTGKVVVETGFEISSLASNSKHLAALSADGEKLQIYSLPDGALIKEIKLVLGLGRSLCLALSADKVFLSGIDMWRILIVPIDKGDVRTVTMPEGSITTLLTVSNSVYAAGSHMNAEFAGNAGRRPGSLYKLDATV